MEQSCETCLVAVVKCFSMLLAKDWSVSFLKMGRGVGGQRWASTGLHVFYS